MHKRPSLPLQLLLEVVCGGFPDPANVPIMYARRGPIHYIALHIYNLHYEHNTALVGKYGH